MSRTCRDCENFYMHKGFDHLGYCDATLPIWYDKVRDDNDSDVMPQDSADKCEAFASNDKIFDVELTEAERTGLGI